jgi:hypothetical protein
MGLSRIQAGLAAANIILSHRQLGSLKRAHHFGLNRTATFGEQLILQDSVTQSINSPLVSFPSVFGAAALAAGDKSLLLGAIGEPVGGTAWLVRGSGLGSSR